MNVINFLGACLVSLFGGIKSTNNGVQKKSADIEYSLISNLNVSAYQNDSPFFNEITYNFVAGGDFKRYTSACFLTNSNTWFSFNGFTNNLYFDIDDLTHANNGYNDIDDFYNRNKNDLIFGYFDNFCLYADSSTGNTSFLVYRFYVLPLGMFNKKVVINDDFLYKLYNYYQVYYTSYIDLNVFGFEFVPTLLNAGLGHINVSQTRKGFEYSSTCFDSSFLNATFEVFIFPHCWSCCYQWSSPQNKDVYRPPFYDYMTNNNTINISVYSLDSYETSVYQNGYTNGYDQGYSIGEQDGYADGFHDGELRGYDEGYTAGVNSPSYSFASLFGSIADTPVLIIRNLFDFDLFGVSALTVILSCFTALIVLYIFRKLV